MWKISLKMLCLKYKQCWEASSFFFTDSSTFYKRFTGSGSLYILSLPGFLYILCSLYILFYQLWLHIHSFLPALAPGGYFQEVFYGSNLLYIGLPAPYRFFYWLQPPLYWFTAFYRFFYRLWLPLKRPGSKGLFLGGFPALDSSIFGLPAPYRFFFDRLPLKRPGSPTLYITYRIFHINN